VAETTPARLAGPLRLDGASSASPSILVPLPFFGALRLAEVVLLPFALIPSSQLSSSESSTSGDGRDFFTGGGESVTSCSSSVSTTSCNDALERVDARLFMLGATLCRVDEPLRALEGGFATFSFSSVSIPSRSTVWPLLRLEGNVSTEVGSTDALVEREDRRGGIAREFRWLGVGVGI
jgi:hypothetical protein